jgi:hypothetical protein
VGLGLEGLTILTREYSESVLIRDSRCAETRQPQ